MTIFVKSCLIILVLLLMTSAEAYATATCDVTTTNVSFVNYNVLNLTPNDSSGTITVTCNWPQPSPPTQPPVVTESIGPSPTSGSLSPRGMRHSSIAETIYYNLYTDTARTIIWGDGTQGSTTVSNKVQRNKPWITTVYGRIPAQQNVSVGLYSDILTVTIMW